MIKLFQGKAQKLIAGVDALFKCAASKSDHKDHQKGLAIARVHGRLCFVATDGVVMVVAFLEPVPAKQGATDVLGVISPVDWRVVKAMARISPLEVTLSLEQGEQRLVVDVGPRKLHVPLLLEPADYPRFYKIMKPQGYSATGADAYTNFDPALLARVALAMGAHHAMLHSGEATATIMRQTEGHAPQLEPVYLVSDTVFAVMMPKRDRLPATLPWFSRTFAPSRGPRLVKDATGSAAT